MGKYEEARWPHLGNTSATFSISSQRRRSFLAHEMETLAPKIVSALRDANVVRYADSMRSLVQKDVRNSLIIAAEMLRRSRLRCYGVPRCAATR